MAIYSAFSIVFPLIMVIFHSYVCLPEGTVHWFETFTKKDLAAIGCSKWWHLCLEMCQLDSCELPHESRRVVHGQTCTSRGSKWCSLWLSWLAGSFDAEKAGIPRWKKYKEYQSLIVMVYIIIILPTDAACCPDINIEDVVLLNKIVEIAENTAYTQSFLV